MAVQHQQLPTPETVGLASGNGSSRGLAIAQAIQCQRQHRQGQAVFGHHRQAMGAVVLHQGEGRVEGRGGGLTGQLMAEVAGMGICHPVQRRRINLRRGRA